MLETITQAEAVVTHPDKYGMVDFHWGFDSHAEAERLANSLREISHKPEIVVLRLSCYDDIAASVTLQDDRHARH